MGQLIEVQSTRLGSVAIIDTDRSLGGQDGETFSTIDEARGGTTFPARLAERLLEADPAITNVYVYSNTVSIQRGSDWTSGEASAAANIVRNFFVHYDENQDA